MRGRRPEEIRRDAMLKREQERKPGTQRAMYVGSISPALKGRIALVMTKRAGVLMAQFDWPSWQQFDLKGAPMDPVDPYSIGWHEFTEGEFEVLREGWGEREDRELRAERQQERAYRRAVADFGGDPGSAPEPRRRTRHWDPGDFDMEHDSELADYWGISPWGSDS